MVRNDETTNKTNICLENTRIYGYFGALFLLVCITCKVRHNAFLNLLQDCHQITLECIIEGSKNQRLLCLARHDFN